MKVDGRARVRPRRWDRYCTFGDYLRVVADVKEHFAAVFRPFKSGLVNSRGNCLRDKSRRSGSVGGWRERLTGIPDGAGIVTALAGPCTCTWSRKSTLEL